uniref:RNase H type-1 domain-containing protein n=1 Tax=Nicotiana tabacum TaxID=4097 RepID=A0A1S4BDP6_TOBAC|nr:PREDICTED: uncharacterized protein LOC107807222 [Nicotiana tabacum]
MPFSLKNVSATYMRATTTLFHNMIHKEIERYSLKLNPAKYAFRVPAGKLLGFVVSRKGIELDASKIKAIQDLPPPKSKKDVMSFLGILNYISRFIAQSTVICEPIFKLLKKDAATKWTEECQKAFSKIKEYLSNPGSHCYYTCLLWTTHLDACWENTKAIKGQELADHLEENPVDMDYESLTTYFPDEEVLFTEEDIGESYPGWRMFFDGAANFKGVGIGALLISELGNHYAVLAKIRFPCTNDMAEYEACILGIRMAVDMNIKELLVIGDSDLLIHRVQDEELDGEPWCYNVKRFLETRVHPENATNGQKRALRRLANHFFLNGEVLYRRTPNLGLLRCVDDVEATRLLEEIHAGTCGHHMNGFTLAKKNL